MCALQQNERLNSFRLQFFLRKVGPVCLTIKNGRVRRASCVCACACAYACGRRLASRCRPPPLPLPGVGARSSTWSLMNLPKRLELLLRNVLALPKACRRREQTVLWAGRVLPGIPSPAWRATTAATRQPRTNSARQLASWPEAVRGSGPSLRLSCLSASCERVARCGLRAAGCGPRARDCRRGSAP